MHDHDSLDKMLNKHLLFISVDIANSTEMKQNILVPGFTNEWMDVIDNTFDVIEEIISYINYDLKSASGKACLNLWKFLGDELIFVTEYSDTSELRNILKLITKHIKKLPEEIKIKEETHISSELKSAGMLSLDRLYFSAWTMFVDYARCRVSSLIQDNLSNLEQAEEEDDRTPSPSNYDYKSPSMDIGFRLAQHKKIGRMFLSVELAYQLSVGFVDECKKDRECGHINETNSVYIHASRGRPMKGVLGGNTYPLYWIDLEEENITKGKSLNQKIICQSCSKARNVAEDCLGIINRFSSVLYDPFYGNNYVVNRTQLKTESGFDGYKRRKKMKSAEDKMSMKENQNPQEEPTGVLPNDLLNNL